MKLLDTTITFYLQADRDFFSVWPPHGISAQEARETHAQNYKEFLRSNQDRLEELLLGDAVIDLRTDEDMPLLKTLYELSKKEIRNQCRIRKYGERNPPLELDVLLEWFGIEFEMEHNAYIRIGRNASHLTRLLFPGYYEEVNLNLQRVNPAVENVVCYTFAYDLLGYIAQLPAPVLDEDGFGSFGSRTAQRFSCVGNESNDAKFFWTFAPYIHLALQEQGLDPNESMGQIVDWVTSRMDEDNGYADNLLLSDRNMRWYLTRRHYQLGIDERMPSHLHVRLLAKSIAKEVYQKPTN